MRCERQTGVYIYFENYGRYDWTRYFYGYLGLDVRWTPARRAAWERKFASVGGVARRVVEVWHEDGSRRGDEEWEQTVCARPLPACAAACCPLSPRPHVVDTAHDYGNRPAPLPGDLKTASTSFRHPDTPDLVAACQPVGPVHRGAGPGHHVQLRPRPRACACTRGEGVSWLAASRIAGSAWPV